MPGIARNAGAGRAGRDELSGKTMSERERDAEAVREPVLSPVVLPFLLIPDVAMAKDLSRAIALVMLFFGGLALGRFAG